MFISKLVFYNFNRPGSYNQMARIYVDNLGYHRGAVCGGVIAYLLIKVLLKRRNALYGLLYGLAAGFIIGLVNGLLTDTAGFCVIIGVVLGPVGGLILAWIFLKVYKPE